MSYLNGPRINFWGGGSTNVDTANNDEYGKPGSAEQLFDLAAAKVVSQKSDAEIIEYLRTSPTPGASARGGWNYYGDHQVAFMDAKVSSAGVPGDVQATGALIGAPVFLLGSVDPKNGSGPYGGPVMVDLDATSGQTTQIYVGGLQIGSGTPLLHIQWDTVCHSRFIGRRYDSTTKPPFPTPGSVYANGTFQVAFPTSAVKSFDSSNALLRALVEAEGAQGIVLRFNMFEHMPGKSPEYMAANYRENRNDANPSLGRIVGTLGPWYPDEPATCPAGRLLQNGMLGSSGVALLDEKAGRLSLDLSAALQGQALRQDAEDNTGPIGPNLDYGDLLIGTAAEPDLVRTASLPETYYVYGGVYDVDVTPAVAQKLTENAIRIGASNPKHPLQIDEAPIRLFGDPRNIYLNEPSTPFGEIRLKVSELGGPLQRELTLTTTLTPSGALPAGEFLNCPDTITVPAGATEVVIPATDNGKGDGYVTLNIALGAKTSASGGYFINFRRYPSPSFGDGPVSWDEVYENALRFFYVTFPAMSKRIPLNDEATIRAVGGEILKRISDEYRGTTLYMPLTRALSPSAVALLRRFLQSESAEGPRSAAS